MKAIFVLKTWWRTS
ncbi:trp operon leader peptide [Escherichia coli]|nr:trp operon leader peptide [Escherichia coli]